MIQIGIIGNLQGEELIYQTLHNSKEIDIAGVYNPGRDFRSVQFQIFHNPIELLELSDAILIYNTERISVEFISLMIRKSKHIYFRMQPLLTVTEAADLLKLQKEAGSVVHLFNPFLAARPGIIPEINPGVKIINMQVGIKPQGLRMSSEIMNALVFLCKLENSPVKHLDVLGLQNNKAQITVNIHAGCSSGSAHNILLSEESIHAEIQIFQKHNSIRFEIPNLTNQGDDMQPFDSFAFQNFISRIEGKSGESIAFEDYCNSLKIYFDLIEKLKYSGIEI
jgi:hypothetical protein